MRIIWPTTLLYILGVILLSVVDGQLGRGFVHIIQKRWPRLECPKNTPWGQGNVPCVGTSSGCGWLGGCQCPNDYGHGDFQCYQSGEKYLDVADNSVTSTLRTQQTIRDVEVAMPCNYKLTEVKTQGTGMFSTCDLQVNILNELSTRERRGDLGIVIYFAMQFNNGTEKKLALRREAMAINGFFKYEDWINEGADSNTDFQQLETFETVGGSGSGDGGITNSFSAFTDDEDVAVVNSNWLPRESIDLGDGRAIRFETDADNFAVLRLPQCGLTLKMRPASGEVAGQEVSGISIAVDRGRAILSSPSPAERQLSQGILTFEEQLLEESNSRLNFHKELFLLMWKQMVPHDVWTPQGRRCSATKNTVKSCLTKATFRASFSTCYKVFIMPELTQCHGSSRSTDRTALAVFNLCMKVECNASIGACSLIEATVQQHGCPLTAWSAIRRKMGRCSNDNTLRLAR